MGLGLPSSRVTGVQHFHVGGCWRSMLVVASARALSWSRGCLGPLLHYLKTVLAFKQVDEMEIWSTERLTCISSADQRLEQHLPDRVEVSHPGWTSTTWPFATSGPCSC